MKKSQFGITLVACLLVVGSLTAFAQFGPPTATPPGANVPPPLNIGKTSQVKNSGLGLDSNTTPFTTVGAGNLLQTKNGNIRMDYGVQQIKTGTIWANSSWIPDPSGAFAIDTDAPIFSHGIITSSDIQSGKSLLANNFKSTSATIPTERPVCGKKGSGELIPCTVYNSGPITATLTLSPTSLSSPGTITATWSSTNATSCVPAHGPKNFDFYQGQTASPAGGFSVTSVTAPETFSIVCTDNIGRAATAVARVGLVPPPAPPIVDLQIDGVNADAYYDPVDYTHKFTLNKIITGGTPTSCSSWTTWFGDTGGPYGPDPQWPGTSGTPGSVSTSSVNYANTDVLPVGSGGVHDGYRTYYITCTNAGGTSSDSITAYIDQWH